MIYLWKNLVNDYERLKIRVVCVGNFEPFMLIN